MGQVTLPDGVTLYSGGDPEESAEPTDTTELAARMFDKSDDPPQLPPEVLAAHNRQASRHAVMSGGVLASVPFNVYPPPELVEPVEQWRQALQVAQDADAAVTLAEGVLSKAQRDAVDARTEDADAPLPDFAEMRRKIDEAQINAEAKLRLAGRANAEMLKQVKAAYPAWRAYVLQQFADADDEVRKAIARVQHAASVRDDMMHTVIELDSLIGAADRPMSTGDGSPTKHHMRVGVRQQVNGVVQKRSLALSAFYDALVRPDTFDWTPESDQ